MEQFTGLWLAKNEGMDPYSSRYIIYSDRLQLLFHSLSTKRVSGFLVGAMPWRRIRSSQQSLQNISDVNPQYGPT